MFGHRQKSIRRADNRIHTQTGRCGDRPNHQRMLTEGGCLHCTADLLFIFAWIQLRYLCWLNNSFTCLVKSKPVKQEVSHTAILPPMVRVFSDHIITFNIVQSSRLDIELTNFSIKMTRQFVVQLIVARKETFKKQLVGNQGWEPYLKTFCYI